MTTLPIQDPALPPEARADGLPMRRRQALGLLPLMGLGQGLGGCASLGGEPPLRDIARACGIDFGSAIGITPPEPTAQRFGFDDAAYRALIARECSHFVPENELKWQWLRPARDRFAFGPADRILAWGEGAGLKPRGHTLFWQAPRWLPEWVNNYRFGPQPVREAEGLLREHIDTVCHRYGSRIASWDVVNESIEPADGSLRVNAFTPHLGGLGQVELAFHLAREAAPQAELVYNDFMAPGAKDAAHRAGVLKLLESLKARKVPVQALGIQAHIGPVVDGWSWRGGEHERDWRRFLDAASSLGLKLLITELDTNDRPLSGSATERDATVAAVTRDFLDVALSYTHLHTLMVWGLADAYSWLQPLGARADGSPKRPNLYDAALKPKALREAVAGALRARA